MKLEGIHHITCITGDAPRNVDFYARVLGLRLVKKTVNQDDPTVYHLFYADDRGSAGADITFFEYPGARPGRAGDGMVHRVVFRVGSEEALDFWAERAGGDAVERTAASLRFADPEGLGSSSSSTTPATSRSSPTHPEIPAEHALRGLRRRARLRRRRWSRSAHAARVQLGFEPGVGACAATSARRLLRLRRPAAGARDRAAAAPCTTSRGPRCSTSTRRGASASPAAAQPTPVIDRFYFRSIYFREPSGVLFEIATLGAGLRGRRAARDARRAAVAAAEASSTLREQIERRLTPLPEPARRSRLSVARSGPPPASRTARSSSSTAAAPTSTTWCRCSTRSTRSAGCAASPRAAPLSLPPGGAHWYVVPRVGFPDPRAFAQSYAAAAGVRRLAAARDGSSSAASRRAR